MSSPTPFPDSTHSDDTIHSGFLTPERVSQERILRLLAENAQDIIFLYKIEPEARYVYVSPASTRLTGYTPEEFYADPSLHHKLVHPEDRLVLDQDADNTSVVEKTLLRWVRKDGSILWTEQRLSPVYDSNGKRIAIEGIVRDVSERAAAQARSDLQIGALNAAANGILISDTRGVIVWANRAMTALTGYLPEELVGQDTRILKSGQQDAAFYEDLWRTISSGEVWRGELLNRRKDGSTYTDEMTITPVRDRWGSINNYIAVKQDVSHRKIYEAEIIAAKEQAEEMARLKTSILSNMSHEIRTPLTGIIGFADILVEILPAEQRELADFIGRSGERLMETLTSVLDLAQLESGHVKPNLEPVDVVLHARQTVHLVRPQADSRGLALTLNVAPSGSFIALADAPALNRILLNLVSNALKFTREGGVEICIEGDEHDVRVLVQDTGIGIDPAFLPFIFDEYAQQSAGTGRDFEGSGLGLTISKRLSDLLGATLTVESEKGLGSTFTLSIPRSMTSAGDAASEELLQVVPAVTFKRCAVLLIDDNTVMHHMVRSMIGDRCDVDCVADGESAMTLAAETKYDAVLLDIDLGEGITGDQVLPSIRALPAYSNVPIIAVTAYALEGDRERFLEAGFDAYMSKPFRRRELHHTIDRFRKLNDA